MQGGLVTRKVFVCLLSICLSVKRVHCNKTEEKSVQILYRAKEHLAFRLLIGTDLNDLESP